MKIVIVNEKQAERQTSGVYYHRLFTPHNYLSSHYNIEVVITNVFTTLSKESKENTDIVIFNGNLPFYTLPHLEMQEIRKYAKVVIMDIDDAWWNYKGHVLEELKKRPLCFRYPKTYPQMVEELISMVDVVTTPSKVIKDKVENDFGKSAYLLPNAIDTSIDQFKPVKREDDGIVWFGYLTNAMHFEDTKLLVNPFQELHKRYGDKFGVVMTGYNDKGDHQKLMRTMMSLNGKIKNFKCFDYVDYNNYARLFNEWDVSLVPLTQSVFNKAKSILKVVESGIMRKPVIVSANSPYLGAIDDYWLAHSEKQWIEAMSDYIEDKDAIGLDGDTLYQQMSEYKMENQVEDRLELYKSLL